MIQEEFILPIDEEMQVQSIMNMSLEQLVTQLGKAIERPTVLVRILASREQNPTFLHNTLEEIRQTREQIIAKQQSATDEAAKEELKDEAYNYARLHDIILCYVHAQEKGQIEVVKRLGLVINIISDHMSQSGVM